MEAHEIPFNTPFSAPMTLAECLELQRQLPEHRFEYLNGMVYEMAGASRIHQNVAGNLFFELKTKLKGQVCQVSYADLAVEFEDRDGFCYPDILVECPPGTEDYAISPVLIAEVLSPSTRLYDLGIKKNVYLTIRSLRHLLLIDPKIVMVEHYFRTDTNELWQYERLSDINSEIYFSLWDFRISLTDLYQALVSDS